MGGVRGSEAERGRAKNGRDSLASSRALERLRGKRKKARETKRRPIGGDGGLGEGYGGFGGGKSMREKRPAPRGYENDDDDDDD